MKNSEDCSAHMLLYHFTSFWNLGTEDCPEKGTIWRDGIKPGSPPESAEHEMRRAPGMPHECVWLTREPFPSGWFIDEDGSPLVPDVRITVRLPTADIRLVKYERWILDNLTREQADQLMATFDAEGRGWREWYCYFGTIGRDRIKQEALAGGFDPDPIRRAAFIEKYRDRIGGAV